MKVINLRKKDFKYQTKGQTIVLKAGEITEVDDTLVTPKKLKDCYGNRIKVIDENAIIEEYKAFSGGAQPVQPEPTKEPEVDNNGDSNEGNGTQEGDEGTKELEEGNSNEGTEENEKPEECKECYADGKTPNEEDCKVCAVKTLNKEGTKEPEENSDEEGTKTKGEKATKPGETKENKGKKQTGKKANKNKNK